MATYQIEESELKRMFGRGLNKEQFCKTFVKIYAMNWQ